MGGGDGTIIIRTAMKQALLDPIVHGGLPEKIKKVIDPVLAKDVDEWTTADHYGVLHAFNQAATHC